ncbi:hypothetical protein SKAU_G00102090 [Synaphobranchus kaupii]|uniref:Uncharacterized protein n=1 Tax=Synaphobranchus kaupii TaxID=118154 RepID=A0A9Q1FYS6_SYNKA|nr:hypothetical protein SKAU_G00102090 [Synaphobranchus kaupii]
MYSGEGSPGVGSWAPVLRSCSQLCVYAPHPKSAAVLMSSPGNRQWPGQERKKGLHPSLTGSQCRAVTAGTSLVKGFQIGLSPGAISPNISAETSAPYRGNTAESQQRSQ